MKVFTAFKISFVFIIFVNLLACFSSLNLRTKEESITHIKNKQITANSLNPPNTNNCNTHTVAAETSGINTKEEDPKKAIILFSKMGEEKSAYFFDYLSDFFLVEFKNEANKLLTNFQEKKKKDNNLKFNEFAFEVIWKDYIKDTHISFKNTADLIKKLFEYIDCTNQKRIDTKLMVDNLKNLKIPKNEGTLNHDIFNSSKMRTPIDSTEIINDFLLKANSGFNISNKNSPLKAFSFQTAILIGLLKQNTNNQGLANPSTNLRWK